jgi:hypothetical protein
MACKRSGVRIPIAPPGHAHISNSEPVTGPAPEGHLRGSSAASVIAVGLLTCGGAEDGPALSAMSRIDDVQEVPSSASEAGRPQQALNTRRSVAGDAPAAQTASPQLARPFDPTAHGRIEGVASTHAYALIGMFTRSLEAWPVSRWDCGLTLSCILGKPDRLLGAADSGTDRRGDRTQISGSGRQPTPARPATLGVGHANPARPAAAWLRHGRGLQRGDLSGACDRPAATP